MTKKHFEAIAKDIHFRATEIYEYKDYTYQEKWTALATLNATVYDLRNTFAKFNPNFSHSTFIIACGVHGLKLELERQRATEIATGV